MNKKLDKLKNLRKKIRVYEDTLSHYQNLYEEDGKIDEFEQQQLDKLQTNLTAIKATLETAIKELSPDEAISNTSQAQAEATSDEASTDDDIVNHALVKERPIADLGELNTDAQLYEYWSNYRNLSKEWNNIWATKIKEHTTNAKSFSIAFLDQVIIFLDKIKTASETYLSKFEELKSNLSSGMLPNSEKRKKVIAETYLPQWKDYLQRFSAKKDKAIARTKRWEIIVAKDNQLKEYLKDWNEKIFPNLRSLLVTQENLDTVQAMYDLILEIRPLLDNLPAEDLKIAQPLIDNVNKDIWESRLAKTKLKFADSEKKRNPVERTDGNPNLPKDKENLLQYETPRKNAELYETGKNDAHKIDDNDLQQGELDNCFAVASIAAIANTNPKLIEDIIEQKSDGSFEVTLYLRTDPNSDKRTKTVIPVKREFVAPKKSNHVGSVGEGDKGELWAKVLDKAIADAFGGYDNLDNKGYPEEILQALTGKSVTKVKVDSKSKEELFAIFQQAINDKKAVTIGSIPSPNGKDLATDKVGNTRLFYSHTYYLEKVTQSKIELKNPHGNNHLNLSWGDFIQFFSHYSKLD